MINIVILSRDDKESALIKCLMQKDYGEEFNFEVYVKSENLIRRCAEGKDTGVAILFDTEGEDNAYNARRIRMIDPKIMPVIITRQKEPEENIINSEIFRYIHPENLEKEFADTMQYAVHRIVSTENVFLSFKKNRSRYSINVGLVLYFSSSHRTITAKQIDGTETKFYGKLDDIEKRIEATGKKFLRIHQSFLVNVSYISSIGELHVQLIDGEILQISKKRNK